MSVRQVFAERLRELRDKAGLTQAELSEVSGVAQSTIARYETARSDPGWEQVVRLARALQVDCTAFWPPMDCPVVTTDA